MRLNAGIITEKIEETKKFYTEKLGFQIVWEADWFILLSTPNGEDTISFMAPDHPTQSLENFRKPFKGEGVFLTIEIENVDSYYKEVIKKGIDLALDIQNEDWGGPTFCPNRPK